MICTEIFRCDQKVSCHGYKNDGLVNFKLVESGGDDLLREIPAEGIRWGFVLSGSLIILSKGKQTILTQGEMFLLCSDDYELQKVSDFKMIFFVSDRPTEYCTQMLAELPEQKMEEESSVMKMEIRDILVDFLNLLILYLKDGLNCRYLFEEKQEELFIILKSCYCEEELAWFLHPLTIRKNKDLKKFIIENCHRAKNVHELATICGYSMGGFKRVFKEIFNEPVYRWMLQQKADMLRISLAEKNVNLKVIIDEFGFSSPAHFTKFCKQWLGMVPTEYIKTQQRKIEF